MKKFSDRESTYIQDFSLHPVQKSGLIQNADRYNGQGIRLLSCNTGALDDGFAQNLANQLNVEVYAPTNYLWATQDGNYFVAGMTNQKGPNMSELGIFKLFIPGGSQ